MQLTSSTALAGRVAPRKVQPFTRPSRQCQRAVTCTATASEGDEASNATRRTVLLSLTAAAALVRAPASFAEEGSPEELKTFFGMATPPTSYGGYGGNANEKPKYAFEYPAAWKPEVINKVQKGTQGIDSRVSNPRNKSESVFVITLSRAGEDAANFALNDIDSTFAGFAGADYDLQDALSYSTEKVTNKRDVDGRPFYDVQVSSPDVTYLSSITVSQGKVFAMFVKSPTKNFKTDEDKYRNILASFRLL